MKTETKIGIETYNSIAEIEGGSTMNSKSGGGSLGIWGMSWWNCFRISCCFWCWAEGAGTLTGTGADWGLTGGGGAIVLGAGAAGTSPDFPSFISFTLYW